MSSRLLLALTLVVQLTGTALPACAEEFQDLLDLTRYGAIDVSTQNRAIEELREVTGVRPEGLFKHILAHPENYSPAVMLVLADKLYEADRRTEAMFWHYAGLLRGQYDANRCADESVQAALDIMARKFGAGIRRYAREQLPTFRQIIAHVIQFEYDTPHKYDHRWINLHGMQAARAVKAAQNGISLRDDRPLSVPQDDWPRIHRATVEAYRNTMARQVDLWAAAGTAGTDRRP